MRARNYGDEKMKALHGELMKTLREHAADMTVFQVLQILADIKASLEFSVYRFSMQELLGSANEREKEKTG